MVSLRDYQVNLFWIPRHDCGVYFACYAYWIWIVLMKDRVVYILHAVFWIVLMKDRVIQIKSLEVVHQDTDVDTSRLKFFSHGSYHLINFLEIIIYKYSINYINLGTFFVLLNGFTWLIFNPNRNELYCLLGGEDSLFSLCDCLPFKNHTVSVPFSRVEDIQV